MSKDEIRKLAALGSQTEEQLAFADEVGRFGLTVTALAVAIYVLSKVPSERSEGELKPMRLLFHELTGEDAELYEDRAKFLVDGKGASSFWAKVLPRNR